MTKLSIAAKTINTDTTDTRSYQPLEISTLTDTFQNRLLKWWKSIAKTHEFEFDAEAYTDGEYAVSLEDLPNGEEFITSLFEPDYGPFSGGIRMTLGELANTLANESSVQFTVNPAKVEAIGKDSKVGFFKLNTFLMPIEVTYLYDQAEANPDESALASTLALSGHIGGGRHRLTFDLTTFQCVDGWEDLYITVVPRGFETVELQSLYILASNGSRTMTPTEKTIVEASAADVDIDSVESLLEAAANDSKMWSKAASLISVNLWDDYMSDTELANAKTNTRGKFGSAILTAAKKAIKSFGNDDDEVNEDTKGLVKLLRHREVFESFMEGALSTFAENFEALKPLAESESGGYNYARFMTRIAAAIAEAVVDDSLIDQLEAIAEQEAELKRQKAKEREAKKAEKAKKNAQKTVEQAKKLGKAKLKALLAELDDENDDGDDDDDVEEVETVIVDEDDDEDDEELEPPTTVRRGRVNRKRR